MRKEKLILDHLLDKRAGLKRDYSIPTSTRFLPVEGPLSGRYVDVTAGGCSIPM